MLRFCCKPWLVVIVLAFSFASCHSVRMPYSDYSAEKSSISKEDQLRSDVLTYARKYVGSKYRYGGTDPKSGFDCSGFTYFVMKEFDIALNRSSRSQESNGRSIKVSEAKAGDLLFFRRSRSGNVFHVALVVSNDRNGLKVIHSTSSRGVIIDNITHSSYWKPKVSTARRVI